jgi:stalled ribosome rescue protein Dom34
MVAKKKLGIWMDYSYAHIMEFTLNPFEIITVESTSFANEKRYPIDTLATLLETRKQLLFKYYNKIANEIQNYNRIILFGPSNAKVEFFDVLSEDERFLKTKVELTNTDDMTQSEQHDFIKEYFSTN